MSKTELKIEQRDEVILNIINKVRILSKNNIFLTKKEVAHYSETLWKNLEKKKELSQFETKLEKFFMKKNQEYSAIVDTLTEMVPFLVAQTVRMYEKGHLASVFSEDAMTSLANQKILDVLARYRKGKVDIKGLKSYFKTSFKNHSQKVYEAHNGTDIRGGIKTVSSEEAMTVAINMNLYNPEKQYIVHHTLNHVIKNLRSHDVEFNERVLKFNQDNTYKQNFSGIIEGLLKGNTAEETCQQLGMINSDYLRQKRLCFDYLKKEMPDVLRSLFSEFEHEEDKRIHVQNVDKRNKRGKEGNTIRESFVLREVKVGKSIEVSLIACLNVLDYNGNNVMPPRQSELKTSKQIVLEVKKANKNNIQDIKNNLLAISKTEITKIKVKKEAELFLNEYSGVLKQYYSKQENAA
jgi:hypothetical protein